jgi:hypothetical protein
MYILDGLAKDEPFFYGTGKIVYIRMPAEVYIYIYLYICIYLCVQIYLHIH